MNHCPLDDEDRCIQGGCEWWYNQDYYTDCYGNECESGFCTHPRLWDMIEEKKKGGGE